GRAGRPRHFLGLRSRPSSFARRRPVAGAPSRESKKGSGSRRHSRDRAPRGAADASSVRRTPRQRPPCEPRPGPRIPGEIGSRMIADRRTSPEDFLRLIEKAKRGRLKIYIGHAAGVGKTYQMLEDAHLLKKRGGDVVVG